MPDVGIPGAEFIFGKEKSDIARLLSNISDYALEAKYLHDLYSASDAAEILGCGYMREDHVIAILNESNMTVDGAATILNETTIAVERVRHVFEDMDATKVWDFIEHGNLTRTFHVWIHNGVGDLNTAVGCNAGCGTQSYGLSFGGQIGYYGTTETEEYTLSTWSVAGVGDLATEVGYSGGFGSQSAGVSCGGWTGSPMGGQVLKTEKYNGSTWSAGDDLSVAVYMHATTGTAASGLSIGGSTPSGTTDGVERYVGAVWQIAGDLNTAVRSNAAAGTINAGLSFGGYSHTTETEEYTETPFPAWSVSGVGDLNTGRRGHGGGGTQNAALCCGGSITSAIMEYSTEEYDGSVWSVTTDMLHCNDLGATFGTQGNAISCGCEGVTITTEAYI